MARMILQTFPRSRYIQEVYICLGDLFIEEANFEGALRMYLLSRKLEINERINK